MYCNVEPSSPSLTLGQVLRWGKLLAPTRAVNSLGKTWDPTDPNINYYDLLMSWSSAWKELTIWSGSSGLTLYGINLSLEDLKPSPLAFGGANSRSQVVQLSGRVINLYVIAKRGIQVKKTAPNTNFK